MGHVVNITEWRGQDVLDRSGQKIARLEDVYYDTESDEAVFLSMKTGLLGRNVTFVPVADALFGRNYVRVAFDKAMVTDAPSIEPDGELTAEGESRLFGYYGLEYAPPPGQGVRRLARR